MTQEFQAALIGGAVAALVSGVITLVAGIVTTILNNRSEERRTFAQLAVSAGTKDFEQRMRFVEHGNKAQLIPLVSAIYISYVSLIKLKGIKLTPRSLENEIAKLKPLLDEISVMYETKRKGSVK